MRTIHYTVEEKAELLMANSCLDKFESVEMAEILDRCPYAELRQISEAIKVMSKGK